MNVFDKKQRSKVMEANATENVILTLVGDVFPANLPMNIGLGVAARFS